MVKNVLFLFVLVFVMGCGNTPSPAAASLVTPDSIYKNARHNDSVSKNLHNPIAKDDGGDVEPTLEEIMHQCLAAYKDTLRIDTAFAWQGKTIKINFTHFCTYDSAIQLPNRYIDIFKLKQFTTHNYKAVLKMQSDDKLIVDTVITKQFFGKRLEDELVLYGVIMKPAVSFTDSSFLMDYSISVPLSDVGVGIPVECSYTGRLQVKNR